MPTLLTKVFRLYMFADGRPWTAHLGMRGRVGEEIISVNTRWSAMKNVRGSYFILCNILLTVVLLL